MTLSAADRRRRLRRAISQQSSPKLSASMGKRNGSKSRSPLKSGSSVNPRSGSASVTVHRSASDAQHVPLVDVVDAQQESIAPAMTTEVLSNKSAASVFAVSTAEPSKAQMTIESEDTVAPVPHLVIPSSLVAPQSEPDAQLRRSVAPIFASESIGPNSIASIAASQAAENPLLVPASRADKAPQLPESNEQASDTWCTKAKGMGRKLQKKGEPFVLPSGESCIKIPNAVIEKNRKSWDCFVLGQFYSDPPSQGTLHNIVNGIWSKTYRDISVSKMEGHSFLFRIPNANTRSRVIYQRLWQIEGQTMFVDKWEPGVIPAKPELTSAPIWLELRQVPFQFFNEDGLERIAGLVGHPKFLHPSTANKTNLEVAKVFTIIDPRKPLPEAVNVQFDSGDISRVLVSSPWMPPVCTFCKEVGHNVKRCKAAPKTCVPCNSSSHKESECPKLRNLETSSRKTRRGRSKSKSKKQIWVEVSPPSLPVVVPPSHSSVEIIHHSSSSLGTSKDFATGDSSKNLRSSSPGTRNHVSKANSTPDSSGVEPDSSDIESSESEAEEGEFFEGEKDFTLVQHKHAKRKAKFRSEGSTKN